MNGGSIVDFTLECGDVPMRVPVRCLPWHRAHEGAGYADFLTGALDNGA